MRISSTRYLKPRLMTLAVTCIPLIIVSILFSGCSCNTTQQQQSMSNPYESGAPVSLPLSAEVTLTPYTQTNTGKVFNPMYNATTSQYAHFSSALSLSEGTQLRITLESDIPISWQDNPDTPSQTIAVTFAQMLTFTPDSGWTTIKSNAVETLQVSSSDNGEKLDIAVIVHPQQSGADVPNIFKLLVVNMDSQSHTLNYTISKDTSATTTSTVHKNGYQEPAINTTTTQTSTNIQTATISTNTPYFTSRQQRIMSYVTPDDPEVKALVNDILFSDSRLYWNDFNALRDWVSWHVGYRSDIDIHGQSDYWQTPAETLELGTGDCEDFAILLCSILRSYGVPADQVFVATGISADKTSAHAYLVERWYRGVWQVVEPQSGGWLGPFLSDWCTDVSYSELYYFNDQEYYDGVPTLPPGVYEFEIAQSYYPATNGAAVYFERYLDAGQYISGKVEWPADRVYADQSYAMVNDWSLNIIAPDGSIADTWSGKDLEHEFSYTSTTAGNYKVEILKRDYLPRCARLTIDPVDWN
ncbi:MAG: transglutaminase domain-containing protein [Dehalococcoidales bacterium]|nr:transglutaminase domain-containing protein [Dehalococcoidales bacterium]